MPSNRSEAWSFKDRDLKTLVSMLKNEVTKKNRPILAFASSSGTEGWNYGKKLIDLILKYDMGSQNLFQHVRDGYYCTNYFLARKYPNQSKGEFLRECLGEIRKLSLIELESAESMEDLREAVRKTKEKNPDARLVNAPEEHRVRDPDYLSKVTG